MYKLLEDMRILDLTRLLPGGYATQLLGDLGAEVLKVEDPWQGDYMRWMEPHFEGTKESALFWGLNRNKKSMKLNLKTSEGREIFFKLIEKYDIVIEGFRPGVMDRLGIGYERLGEINQRIIMCSISGYGQDGPYKDRSGHDLNYTALAGSLGLTGIQAGQPVIPALQIADLGGGAFPAVVGILAACLEREKTGRGKYIDVSMLDGVVSWMTMLFMQIACGDPTVKRGEGFLGGGVPCYNLYLTKDGKYMALGALEEIFWHRFCTSVQREELIKEQFSREKQIKMEVEKIFASKTREDWVKFFKNEDICCEPVLEPEEIKQHPQIQSRKLFQRMMHPTVGPVEVTANPLKFKTVETEADKIPPAFGENTLEVISALGYTSEQISQLSKKNII